MVAPTHLRKDGTVPVITIGLDGKNNGILKKFKCSVCGGTVFGYYDTLKFLLPVDAASNDDAEHFYSAPKPLREVECTHRYKTEAGRSVRCRTIYVIVE